MAFGHLLAVTTKVTSGALEGRVAPSPRQMPTATTRLDREVAVGIFDVTRSTSRPTAGRSEAPLRGACIGWARATRPRGGGAKG